MSREPGPHPGDGPTLLAGLLVLALAVTGLQVAGLLPRIAAAGTELHSAPVSGALPVTDPSSDAWSSATPVSVPLSGQVIIRPTLDVPAVPSLEVRSLNNATHIAFRVSWSDDVADNRTTSQTDFRDAVAIQIGRASQLPFICMGSATSRMHIMQWKADWQADIEEGFHDLQDEFPNFWVDYYPYAIGEPPYELPDAFGENASLFLVGYEVGNPFSQPLKVTPVEDAVADGYTTITTQAVQNAIGRGVWSDGRWSVVIARPKGSADGQDTPIEDGNVVAFAVWDGDSGNVGSRKSVSTWATLRVRSPAESDVVPRLLVTVAVLAVTAFVLLLSVARRRKREPPEGR
jgi:hypothetical protein